MFGFIFLCLVTRWWLAYLVVVLLGQRLVGFDDFGLTHVLILLSIHKLQ